MKSPRFSIAAMMGIVLAIGIGLAGLARPSPFWSAVNWTVVMGFLATLTVGAILGRRRPFWIGSAVFGWSYVVLSDLPMLYGDHGTLPMNLAMEAAYPRLHPEAVKIERFDEDIEKLPEDETVHQTPDLAFSFERYNAHFLPFVMAGHSLACLIAALIGGLVGLRFAAQREKAP